MTREQLLAELQQEYARRREENMRLYEQRRQEACARCDGLAELLSARHAALLGGVRSSLLAPRKNPVVNAGLPNAMAEYNERIAAALNAGGLEADALQPVYTCSVCRDEGYVYDPSRRMCDCMARELNRRMLSELGLDGDSETFERFDETLFDSEPDGRGVSQRQMVKVARDTCLRYADDFPKTETRDLLLTGKSGLGKTYLLRAIARRVAERGFMPLYTSAYRLFEVARRAYMENHSELMGQMMNAPLLLLDDLGTEPLMTNVTVTQLFNLLNERQLAGRHTVISTNLTVSELRERYTERVTSRFLDASECVKLVFTGEDIRKNLKKGVRQA